MVKIHVDRQQGVNRAQMRGSLGDVCDELGCALFALYRNLCREDRETAEQFRNTLWMMLGGGSSTWDESLEYPMAERCEPEAAEADE